LDWEDARELIKNVLGHEIAYFFEPFENSQKIEFVKKSESQMLLSYVKNILNLGEFKKQNTIMYKI